MNAAVIRAALGLAVLLVVGCPARAQTVGVSGTPEDEGAREGQSEGRLAGLESGRDEGRAQALAAAWMRGFRRGLADESTWRRGASWDEGRAEGERPGRAEGLVAGQARGGQACAAAFLLLEGRPSLMTEPAPPAPPPPPAPAHPACREPVPLTLRFDARRSVEVRRQDCESGEPPLGWDVPRPDYPDASRLRDRARMDGFEDDALEAWIRGYKQSFKHEFTEAYRTTRDATPGHLVREWELEGLAEGRREGERRRACEDFGRGFETGWRDGFEAGFERGFVEAWEAEEQAHLDHAVVRIVGTRLLDDSSDGVVEPGERVHAEIALANAGLRDTQGPVLTFDGVRTVAARGSVGGAMRAQSRRTEVIDLGEADAGAPLGAGLEVRLQGENGDALALEGDVGRPVVLDGADARLDVAEGALVTRVRVAVVSVATRDADRGLSVAAGGVGAGAGASAGAASTLGVVRAGERRDVELVVPARPSDLAEGSSGSVELRSGDATWMRRDWSMTPRFGDSLLTAARLPAGSRVLDDSLTALSRRLHAELALAMEDPKLYARLDDGSDLSELARVRPSLPAATRADVESRLARPLMQHAEAKGTPRKVRRAIREALGRPG